MGAWIETFSPDHIITNMIRRTLTWVRGLKHLTTCTALLGQRRTLTWVRGLKHCSSD